MANIYVVDSSSTLQDGDTVVIGGVTYTVEQIDDGSSGGRTDVVASGGDNVLLSGDLSGTVTIAPAGGTAETSPLNVTMEATTDSYTLRFSDPLLNGSFNPTITVPDGVDASGATINGTSTDGMTVNVGDNASLGDVAGGTDSSDADIITTGTGSTIGNIDTNAGDDVVTIGGTAGSIQTEGGDDTVTVLAGSTTGDIDVGSGGDSIALGDGATVGALDLGTDGGSGDTITGGTGVTVNGDVTQSIADDVSDVSFGDNTTINGSINLRGGSDTLTFGENSSITGSITMGSDGSIFDADYLEIGAGSTVDSYINTNAGGDTVIIGDNATLGSAGANSINTYIGNDQIIIGEGVVAAGPIFTGAGSDTVEGGSGSYDVNQGINIPNSDATTVRYGFGNEDDFLQALAAQGFSDPDGDGVYTNGSNSSFIYNGVTYTNIDFLQGIPCFARGTLIETDRGAVAIEDLAVGDLVMTRDNGFQKIRWIGSRRLDAAQLFEHDKLRPIRISRHALGTNIPSSDLLVSPQHRILVRSKIAQKMFGTDEILVAAKQLCQMDGIDIADDVTEVEYFHMLFDHHEVVISNGTETESLYTGPEALKSVGLAALTEIFAIFPELKGRDYVPVAARTLATGRMGRKLAVRHKQNSKALVSQGAELQT